MFGRETPAAGGPAAPASAPVGADDRAVRTGARGGASQVPANPHDADSVDDAPWEGRKSLSRRVRKRVSLRVRLDTFSGHRRATIQPCADRSKDQDSFGCGGRCGGASGCVADEREDEAEHLRDLVKTNEEREDESGSPRSTGKSWNH